MTRRRWIYPGNGAEPIEVTQDYTPEPRAPLIFGDLPEYRSPVTGLVVSGRRARREDLKRTGSRPYEGLAEEKKEAARQKAYDDARQDAALTRTVSKAFYQLPQSKRELLKRM